MKAEWSVESDGVKRKKRHAGPLDDDLIIESRLGNQRAFEEIYRRYRPHVWDLCNRMVGDPGWAEDLTQETFIRAYQRLVQFEQGRALWPWLATVARNICLDEMRVRQKRPLAGKEEDSETSDEPTSDLTSEEAIARHERTHLRARVLSALATLQPSDRRVVLLRAVEGWSYRDIARHDGRSIHAVRNAAWRARTVLRALLDDDRYLGSLGIIPLFWTRIKDTLARFKDRVVHLTREPNNIASLTLGEHTIMGCIGVISLAASFLTFSDASTFPTLEPRRSQFVGAHTVTERPDRVEPTVSSSHQGDRTEHLPRSPKSTTPSNTPSLDPLTMEFESSKPREKHLLSEDERFAVYFNYTSPRDHQPYRIGIEGGWKCGDGKDTGILPSEGPVTGSC